MTQTKCMYTALCTVCLYWLGQFEWNVAWIFPTCSNWMFFLEQICYKSSFGGFPFIFLLSHLHPFTCPAQRMSPICKIMITQICIFFESPLNTERINWKSIVVDIIMMERKGLKVSLLHSLCPGTLVSNCLKPCQRAIWKTSLIHK